MSGTQGIETENSGNNRKIGFTLIQKMTSCVKCRTSCIFQKSYGLGHDFILDILATDLTPGWSETGSSLKRVKKTEEARKHRNQGIMNRAYHTESSYVFFSYLVITGL